MIKRYFPPVAESISIVTFVIAASGDSLRARTATDFDNADYDEGDSWNIWSESNF
jgi:hypothetical protein